VIFPPEIPISLTYESLAVTTSPFFTTVSNRIASSSVGERMKAKESQAKA
jgi:hypothetical protein